MVGRLELSSCLGKTPNGLNVIKVFTVIDL